MPIFFYQTSAHQIHHIIAHQTESIRLAQTGSKRLTNSFMTCHQLNLLSDNATIASTPTSNRTTQPQVFYTREFGNEPLPSTVDGLKKLLADEAVSFFDNLPDLTNFYNAIYAQFGEKILKQIADAHLLPNSVAWRRHRDNLYGTPDRRFYNTSGQLTLFVPGSPNADGEKPAPESIYYPHY